MVRFADLWSLPTRKARLVAAAVLVTLVLAEAQCYLMARVSMASGNPFSFYSASLFHGLTGATLDAESAASHLGWPADDRPRAQPATQSTVCGSAFGDSMTRGDEVADHETWVYLLSRHLGCDIRNYAVGGYGLDQALLRYEKLRPEGRIVIVGVFIEMLRRSLAASWTFYQGPAKDNQPQYSRLKPYFVLENDALSLTPRPAPPITREAIVRHHARDYYWKAWTPVQFPYTYAVARGLATRFWFERRRFKEEGSNWFWLARHRSGAAPLALTMLSRLRSLAQERGTRLAIVMIPRVEDTIETAPYTAFAHELRRREPAICIIDPFPALVAEERQVGLAALMAPLKHYSSLGNHILANAVSDGLRRCGFF